MGKVKNLIRQKYDRERRRIQSNIRKLKKAGYDVLVDLPKIPKKVTEGSVRRLQKITTRGIQEKALKVDYSTGEIINARQAKVRETRARAEKRSKEKKIKALENEVNEYRAKVNREKYLEELEQKEDDFTAATEVLFDVIEQKINAIADKPQPEYGKKVSSILKSGFNDFCNAVKDLPPQDCYEALSSIAADHIFDQVLYGSDDIDVAKSSADNMRQLGSRLQSQPLKDMADEMSDFDDTADVWYEIDADDMMDFL